MKKSQIKVFEELLQDKDFKGKKSLKHLLWLNTVKPKYEIGQFVKVTNYAHRIYGHQVINFKAKVIEHRSYNHTNEWFYTLEMEVTCDGKTKTFEEYAPESDIKGGVRNNKNVLTSKNGEFDDCLSV